MRIFFGLAFAILLSLPAEAQIVGIRLNSDKARKKMKKYLTEIDGEQVICGEPKKFIRRTKTGAIQIHGKANDAVELWVADPKDPLNVPFTLNGDLKVQNNKKGVVKIPKSFIDTNGQYLKNIGRNVTFQGLATEYGLKVEAITASEGRVKEQKRLTTAWFNAQRQLMARCDRLSIWLKAGIYKQASAKWFKKAEKIRKLLKGDALAERKGISLKSAKKVGNPEGLDQISAKGKKFQFVTIESKHVRMIADVALIPEKRAMDLVKKAEEIIEGFRREFVDEYAEEFPDNIPDEKFVEFFFMQKSPELFETYWLEFYGRTLGRDRERRLQMMNTRAQGVRGMPYVHFTCFDLEADMEGSIAHALGHDLANIHFNDDHYKGALDWLEEGCAYYVSFEFLGRNSVTCYQFKHDKYASNVGEEGLKTLQTGQRASFNAAALKSGVPMHALMPKELYEMKDADLCKSWSFFDYLARKRNHQIVQFLRLVSQAARGKAQFHGVVRETTAEMFDLKPGQDVFKYLDDAWKKYAKSGQKKVRKKRRR